MAKNESKRAKWTFMVYMAGDNDLDPNGVTDIKEMKRIGSTPEVNVVAEFDRSRPHAAKRYLLRKGGTAKADVVADVGPIDTGDPKCLTDFVKWATDRYPAERYILVLWNHGEGWDDTDLWPGERSRRFRRFASLRVRHALFHTPARRLLRAAQRSPQSRAILIDNNAKDFLDNQEMKRVLQSVRKRLGRKLDVLGMDACLMSMAEVGYQCRRGAEFTVGSTETEPLEGWPYHTILKELTRRPQMTGRELSRLIVAKYLASYPSDQVTQSAFDLGQAEQMATAVRGLAKTLLTGVTRSALRRQIMEARAKVQYYDDEVMDNIDLVDFCRLLMQAGVTGAVRRACTTLLGVLKRQFVVAAGAKGPELKHSHGISIYFPNGPVSPLYPGLDFSRRTGWDKFLKAYRKALGVRRG